MARSYSWMKLWVDILEDWKVASLPDNLWRRFVELCLIAKKVDNEGYLPCLELMAFVLRVPEAALKAELEELERLTKREDRPGIVQQIGERWFVTNLVKRQAPLTNTERKRRQRARERKRTGPDEDTPGSRKVTTEDRGQTTEDRGQKTEDRQQTTEPGANKGEKPGIEIRDEPAVVAVLEEMEQLGITGKKAMDLIGQYLKDGNLPFLLPRLTGWILYADEQPNISSRRGFAINQAEQGRDPPGDDDSEYWRRLIRKQDLEKMGICPKCWTRPCVCEEGDGE